MTTCRSCGDDRCFLWAAIGGGLTEPLCFRCWLCMLKVAVWRGVLIDDRSLGPQPRAALAKMQITEVL